MSAQPYQLVVLEEENLKRIALVQDRTLLEYIEESSDSLVGAILLGRVERVLPDIKAAFVKIGQPLNGFLPLKEAESFHKTCGSASLMSGQDILVQVNIGREASKGGCLPEQTGELCALACALPGVALRGLMAIPPAAETPEDSRAHFAAMRELFVDIKGKMSDNQSDMVCLSMGMSGDFAAAVAEGATLVRVGTALFGARPPMKGQQP